MSYLSKLDSALRFKDWRDFKKVCSVIFEIMKNEKLSFDEEFYLLDVVDRLLACDYIECNPIRTNYNKLLNFLDIGEELFSYLKGLGIV